MLRPMTEGDLVQVLNWRNDPEVRRFMITQQEIAFEDHRNWFQASSANPSLHLLIFEDENGPQGHMNFKIDYSSGIADWGFYSGPGAPKGTGRVMGRESLKFAFETLGLHKVCGQVLDFNERSKRMHLALGFVEEGVLRQHKRVNDTYRDLYCYGILADEWKQTERETGP
jgi:UDP-4-amino-4,6-dideoxy-N-acetyl-beta-L-altrosamine N-acetyltransferase